MSKLLCSFDFSEFYSTSGAILVRCVAAKSGFIGGRGGNLGKSRCGRYSCLRAKCGFTGALPGTCGRWIGYSTFITVI